MTEEKLLEESDKLIDVREGEEINAEKLGAYLRGKLEGSGAPPALRQFGGGHANLTYLLTFGEGASAIEYVLRRPPIGPVAKSAHDMGREYQALSRLYRVFPPAPRAFLHCDDPAIIGAPFFVMERRHGVVVRREVPPELGGGKDPVANRKLSEVVIDTLAEFHAVDPAACDLQDIGKPEGFLRRQVEGWTERYERSKTSEAPLAIELSRWLLEHLPASPAPSLLHNDWRLDNMAVAADDPGKCVAVYDWDMCTLGDPLTDLGTVLCLWVNRDEEFGGSAPMPTQTPGFMSREEAAQRYADRSGRKLAILPYYLVFGTFKVGVVLQQIYHRYHIGQTKDERFAGFGAMAEFLFALAAARRP
ncbi:MAG: phosphotransferase family protein [Deltaproteobacteria bacterium]|nr:phosphotransferase family protein [Deltaproteobacteria bacterium]